MRIFGYDITKSDKSYQENQGTESQHNYKSQEILHGSSILYDKSQFKPYNPAQLYQKRGDYSLYDLMREDDQVHSALTIKKNTILGTDWYIDSDNEKIKEFWEISLKELFSDDDGHTFENVLFEKLTALDYGFSLSEIIPESINIPKIDNKPYWILKNLKTKPPHSFELFTDNYGNLSKILQWGTNGEQIEINANKVALFTHQGEFGNPYGRSDLNISVYRSYWSKDNIIKFLNIALERFGSPLLKGTHPDSISSDDRERFLRMMKNVMTKTAFTMPNGFDITTIGGGGSISGAFDSAIDKHNLMIARAILIPDLLGFSGKQSESGGLGGNMGGMQYGAFVAMCKRINRELVALINRRIIKPFTKYNFGEKADAELKFRHQTKEEEIKTAKVFFEFIKTGKYSPTKNQLEWVMNILDAPTDDMDDEQETQEQEPQPEKEPTTEEEENEEMPQKENVSEEPKKHSDFFRDKTKYEKKIDFKQLENTLDELNESNKNKIAKQIKEMINNLMLTISKKKIIENKKFTEINDLKLKDVQTLKKLFKNMLFEARSAGVKSINNSGNYSVIEIGPAMATEEVAAWLNDQAVFITGIEVDEILKKTKVILTDGIRSGAGVDEVVKMLNKEFKKYDISFDATRLENIVRTNTLKAFNQTRLNEFSKNKEMLVGYQFSAIMDGRTSDVCSEYDGKVFPVEEADKLNPPLHHQCRSVLVPVFKDEVDENFEFDKLPSVEQEQGGFLRLKK